MFASSLFCETIESNFILMFQEIVEVEWIKLIYTAWEKREKKSDGEEEWEGRTRGADYQQYRRLINTELCATR